MKTKSIEISIIEELKQMQEDIKLLAYLILTSDNDFEVDKKLLEYEDINMEEFDRKDDPFYSMDLINSKLNSMIVDNHRFSQEWVSYLKDNS